MTTLTDLKRLARAAITHEPSDHGKLSTVRMRVWQEALDDFHDEAHPERILAMIAVIEAAMAMRREIDNPWCLTEAYDALRAKLEKEQT